MEKIEMTGEEMPLNKLLKYNALVGSGGQAKLLIQDGEVELNGEVCTVVRKRVRPGDIVSLGGESFEVVLEETEE